MITKTKTLSPLTGSREKRERERERGGEREKVKYLREHFDSAVKVERRQISS